MIKKSVDALRKNLADNPNGVRLTSQIERLTELVEEEIDSRDVCRFVAETVIIPCFPLMREKER